DHRRRVGRGHGAGRARAPGAHGRGRGAPAAGGPRSAGVTATRLSHILGAVPPLRPPLLEPHRAALETCVYCPKLSRAACPVSNVEHSETVTPWGKMSMAYFAARGDVPLDTA